MRTTKKEVAAKRLGKAYSKVIKKVIDSSLSHLDSSTRQKVADKFGDIFTEWYQEATPAKRAKLLKGKKKEFLAWFASIKQ